MGNFQMFKGISGTVIHKRHNKLTFILKSEEFFLRHSIHVSDSNISKYSGKLLNTVFSWCFQKYLNQRKELKLFDSSKFWQEDCNVQNVPQVTWTRYRYHKRTQKPDNKVLLRLFRFFVPGLFFSLSKAVFGLSEISGIKMFWLKNFLNNSKINCDSNFFFSFWKTLTPCFEVDFPRYLNQTKN